MAFNPDKCEVLRVTNKRHFIPATYSIHGQQLQITSNTKYLGVTIDRKLSWNPHIDSVTQKANNSTAFLRRNLSSCPKEVKATCYKSLVRPQLEYMRQQYGIRLQRPTYPRLKQYNEGLLVLSLETTGERAVSPPCYNTWDGWTSRHVDSMPKPPWCTALYFHHTGTHTRGHASRFLQPFTTVNSYRDSFFPSGIRLWNSLPVSLIDAPSLEVFQTRMVAEMEWPDIYEMFLTCF